MLLSGRIKDILQQTFFLPAAETALFISPCWVGWPGYEVEVLSMLI